MKQYRIQPSHCPDQQAAHGQIMVVFALLLVVLLAMAGLAVDLSHVRSTAEDVQQAADAAALAGVVYLPESAASTPAEDTARAVAAANHFGNGPATTVSAVAYGSVRRLKVTITTKVATPFLNVIGRGSITVTRSATAAYSDPVEMGANDHLLGVANYPTNAFNAVTGTLTGVYPQGFYLQLKAPYGGLEHGDAFTPFFETTESGGEHLVTSPDASHKYVDPCTGSAAVSGSTPPYNNKCLQQGSTSTTSTLVPNPYFNQQNADSGQSGYSFIFTLPPNMPHAVLLKALDPLDTCALDTNSTLSNLPASSGVYKIYNVKSNTKLLSVNPTSGSHTSGQAVVQYSNLADNTDKYSQWQFIEVSDGTTVDLTPSATGGPYFIVNGYSGMALGVRGRSTTVGATLEQETLDRSNTSQQWKLVPRGSGTYNIVSNNSGGLYVDNASSTSNNAPIYQNSVSSTQTNKQWTLVQVPNVYTYAGSEAYYDPSFGTTTGWTADQGIANANYPTIYAAKAGSNPTGAGDSADLVSEGTANLDACDNVYNDNFHPNPLQFTIHAPSLRSADNTSVPDAGTTASLGQASVTVGVNPITTGAEFKADIKVPGCTGPCVIVADHANDWLTLGKAINQGPVPAYIRVTVTAVMNNAYWASGVTTDPYTTTADHPFDDYGAADSGTFGTGGNVFGLGVCDIIASPGVSSTVGSVSDHNFDADPGQYGNIFNPADWESADTSGVNPDLGCPDPNLDTGFTITNTFRFQVNARDGMCIMTYSGSTSGNVTNYIPLAELGPRFAGKTVTVRLFDPGDVGSWQNYISIMQPSDNPGNANFTSGRYVSGSAYPGSGYASGHTYTNTASPNNHSFQSYPYRLDIMGPPGTSYSAAGTNRPPFWCNTFSGGADYSATSPPAGHASWCPPETQNQTDQAVQVATGSSNAFANGVWLEFQITLPTTYDPADGMGWWKVAYHLTGSGNANDTTTWQVASSAAPVQLVSES